MKIFNINYPVRTGIFPVSGNINETKFSGFWTKCKILIKTLNWQNYWFFKIKQMLAGKLIGHNDEIYESIFLGIEDRFAALATNSADIRVYDLENCQCQLLADGHNSAVLSLDVAPFDKNLMASCSKGDFFVEKNFFCRKFLAKIWKNRSIQESNHCLLEN